MSKFTFSGHETFHCRHFWLKKGYDFLIDGNKFNQDDAVVKLGVGKNMVASIRFWLKAFDLINEDETPSYFAQYLFGENGKDPYLEDPASLWLLHYMLIRKEYSSIYALVFDDFLKTRNEFTREHLLNFIKRKASEHYSNNQNDLNDKTLLKDINVFLKNYVMPKRKVKNIEEDFVGLMIDLNLIHILRESHADKDIWFKIENRNSDNIPSEIILFALLDQLKESSTVELNRLLNDKKNIGLVFVLNSNSLVNHIQAITKKYPELIFTEDAGIRVVQIKKQIDKWDILNRYYAS